MTSIFCYYSAPFPPLLEASVVCVHVILAAKRCRAMHNQSINCILGFFQPRRAPEEARGKKDYFTPFSLSELSKLYFMHTWEVRCSEQTWSLLSFFHSDFSLVILFKPLARTNFPCSCLPDDEACLGQLQTVWLGSQRAEAPRQEGTFHKYLW